MSPCLITAWYNEQYPKIFSAGYKAPVRSLIQANHSNMGCSSAPLLVKVALIVSAVAFLFHLIGYGSNSWQKAELFGETTAEEGLWKTCNYALGLGCRDYDVVGSTKIAVSAIVLWVHNVEIFYPEHPPRKKHAHSRTGTTHLDHHYHQKGIFMNWERYLDVRRQTHDLRNERQFYIASGLRLTSISSDVKYRNVMLYDTD